MSKKTLGIVGAGLVLAAVYFFSTPKRASLETKSVVEKSEATSAPEKKSVSVDRTSTEESRASSEPATSSVWKLDSSNFEYRVSKCFAGEACELEEEPLALYRYFKKTGNRKANDLLISYLRKNLKDPKFADRYKVALKSMIEDFYPREEKQFQEAAYYNYLGDLQKSLSLYLDLEKKAAVDSSNQSQVR